MLIQVEANRRSLRHFDLEGHAAQNAVAFEHQWKRPVWKSKVFDRLGFLDTPSASKAHQKLRIPALSIPRNRNVGQINLALTQHYKSSANERTHREWYGSANLSACGITILR